MNDDTKNDDPNTLTEKENFLLNIQWDKEIKNGSHSLMNTMIQRTVIILSFFTIIFIFISDNFSSVSINAETFILPISFVILFVTIKVIFLLSLFFPPSFKGLCIMNNINILFDLGIIISLALPLWKVISVECAEIMHNITYTSVALLSIFNYIVYGGLTIGVIFIALRLFIKKKQKTHKKNKKKPSKVGQ